MVIYESKYGNTKLVAETIVEGMKTIPGAEITLHELKEVDVKQLPEFDVILLGSPNHMGRPTGGILRFIGKLGKLPLTGKQVAAFDTYMNKDFEKAVKKMEKQVTEKAPELKLIAPGLSIRVEGMRGPIAPGELAKAKEFGVKIASLIKTPA